METNILVNNMQYVCYAWRNKQLFIRFVVLLALFFVAPLAAAQESSAPKALIDRVLQKADTAFLAKHYTQPQHNNAYDRYQAVLLIDPDNIRAQAGLKQIEAAYVAMLEGELSEGSVQHARYFLSILKEYYPHSSNLAVLQQKVAAAMTRQLPAPDFSDLLTKKYDLNGRDLAARNAKARGAVVQIAQRVEKSREAVLILARNDAEGRWIYQVMNEATPAYRVRGDIQLRNSPAIHLLEPL